MIEALLTAIPSLCWMFFRCYQLFKTPTNKLGDSLNLDIPHTPLICVDSLDDRSVVLHWDIETLPDENIFYVILINGKDAGTLAQSVVKLTNLDPEFMYKIQIVATNAISNFRSQSDAIYVRTLPEKKHRKTLTCISKEHGIGIRSNGTQKPNREINLEISVSAIENLNNEIELRMYLLALYEELNRNSHKYALLSSTQHHEEKALRDEIQYLKKELHGGSEARAKKDSDLKQLEQKKSLLTFTKLKLLKLLKNYNSQRALNLNKLAELRLKIAKLAEKHHYVQNVAETERDKTRSSVLVLNEDISVLRAEILKAEEQIKHANTEKKDAASVISQLKPLVDQFIGSFKTIEDSKSVLESSKSKNEPIFNQDGGLTDLGNGILERIYLLLPEWVSVMNHELEKLHGLESSWRNTFRLSLRKYISVFHSLEGLKAAADPSYVPKRMTEYKASIDFGGHAYALPNYLISGDMESSLYNNEAQFEKWYELSRGTDYESSKTSAQVSDINLRPMSEVPAATPQTSLFLQQEYQEFEPYMRDSQDNRSHKGSSTFQKFSSINLQQQQKETYPAAIVNSILVSRPRMFGSNYSDMQDMETCCQIRASALSPVSMKQSLSQNPHHVHRGQPQLTGELLEKKPINAEGNQTFASPMQHKIFSKGHKSPLSSPPTEQSLLYSSSEPSNFQNILWNKNSQSGFVDSHRKFTGLTLPNADKTSPTITQRSVLTDERVFVAPENVYGERRASNDRYSLNEKHHFNDTQIINERQFLNVNQLIHEDRITNENLVYSRSSLLNNFSFPQSSIWLENSMTPHVHNRTVFSGRQLWKNDHLYTDTATENEFSPFQ